MTSLRRWLLVGAGVLAAGLVWSLRAPVPSVPNAPAAAPSSASSPAPALPGLSPAESPGIRAPNAPVEDGEPITRTTYPHAAPTISVDDLPTAVARAEPRDVRPAPVAPAPASSNTEDVSAASTFREELALIEAARTALSAGDGEKSVRRLDEHDLRFRHGVLAAEADITRIEALVRLGRRDEAEKRANGFVARNPDSPFAARARALVAPSERSVPSAATESRPQ